MLMRAELQFPILLESVGWHENITHCKKIPASINHELRMHLCYVCVYTLREQLYRESQNNGTFLAGDLGRSSKV